MPTFSPAWRAIADRSPHLTPRPKQVAAARLDALENDNADAEDGAGSDSEYELEEADAVGVVLKKKGSKGGLASSAGKRKTRGAAQAKRGPRSFAGALDVAMLDRVPASIPTYLTAAAAPGRTSAPRKFCSVCGFVSKYSCARCGMKFCGKKCNAVLAETRCLKFTVG